MNRIYRILFAIATVASLTSSAALAAEARAETNIEERNTWFADTRALLPRLAKPPVIDGNISPGEWDSAAQFGAQVSQGDDHIFYPRVVIWHVGWDAENIYLGSRTPMLENERPKRLARSPVGPDVMFDDTIEMWLDPKGRNAGKEIASYFQAMVNALGVTYFARLYPSVGAKTEDWKPGWTIASSSDEKNLDIEIKMPVKDFGLPGNKVGDMWGMMLARNFMYRNWNQSPLAYAMPSFGFAVHGFYPLMKLTDGKPVVHFRSPLGLYDGKACCDATVVNAGAKARKVAVTVTIAAKQRGKPDTSLFTTRKDLDLPAGGKVEFKLDQPTDPPIDITKQAQYEYSFTAVAEDGTELFHTHFPFDPSSKLRTWLTTKFPPPSELSAQASFNPVNSLLEARVDVIDFPRKADVAGAKVVVTDQAGKVIRESATDRTYMLNYVDLLQLPPLPADKYAWKASVVLKDGSEVQAGEGTFEKKDEAKVFPWWGNHLGDVEKVVWPYTPLRVQMEGSVLHAWGKEYHIGALALPTQILSSGNVDRWPPGRSGGSAEVLAEPIHLQGFVGGKAMELKPEGKTKVVSAADHRVRLEAQATAAGLRVKSATALEQDGAYFVDLTLEPAKPGEPVTVDSLDLVIPVRIEVADFINAYAHCGYSGYVIDALGTRPVPDTKPADGRVTVWNASLNGAPSVTVGNFTPQIWLGNEFRGLLWFADSDRGWTPTDGKHSQEVVRTDKAASMIHHLISVPTEIAAPRTIRFVLQASPFRPLQKGWRMLNTNFSQSFLPWDQMGRSGSAYSYSAAINLKDDAAYAKSKAFAERWPAWRSEQPNLAMYFAPHTETSQYLTSIHADNAYFAGDWAPCTYSKTMNDQALWYLAKWIDQGGLQGIYHDQFSPHRATSLTTGMAYLLPDGRVQPAFCLTTRRNFVMREHALWLEKGINPPRTLTHTTNGGPLSCFGWVESCLDGEDKMVSKSVPLDWADTWPSTRIRAGSISYNFGTTFCWMRLIDTTGMSKPEQAHHLRVFLGHCMMHDVINPFGFDSGTRTPALLAWGMNDEAARFWPFWSNGDAVTLKSEQTKVSAWTLGDRVLLCLFNYSKTADEDCTVTVDLAAMGVKLPEGAAAWNLEEPATKYDLKLDGPKATAKVRVPRRSYVLVGLGAVK